jgi:hypothetical protein
MHRERKVILDDLASAARTATAAGGVNDGEQIDSLIVYIDITAYTSGTFQPVLQGTPDDGTNWYDVAAGTAFGAAGNHAQIFEGPVPKRFRINYVGATTPVATFRSYLEKIRSGG